MPIFAQSFTKSFIMNYYITRDLFTNEIVIIDQTSKPIAAFSTIEDARSYVESLIVKP